MQDKSLVRRRALLAGAAGAALLAGCGGGGEGGSDAAVSAPSALSARALPGAAASLTQEETAALRYMREEEKLAHDVYATLFAAWGLSVFDNIAASETRHTEAIRELLVAYGIDDPALDRPAGVFEDATLQALYDQLVASGRQGPVEALKVGALIEETDIRDINAKKAITDHADILQVYDNLLCGSGNHLRAFNEQLLARGVAYVPQVITQEEWDAIASAPAVVCGG